MTGKSNKRRKNPIIILGLSIIVFLVIPKSLKVFTKSAFEEFQAPIWELSSRVDDITNYWGHKTDSKITLIEKGRNLARLHSDLKLQKDRAKEINNEIDRLKKLKNSLNSLNNAINLDPKIQFRSEIARVSVRKMSSWWQQFTIRKGKNYGIEFGDGVVYNGGVLGRISDVYSRSANVELITNPNFRIVAHFSNDLRPVTYQGNGIDLGGKLHGLVYDVPHDIKPLGKIPLKLVSSSLGGNLPYGIPIGKVYSLRSEENGLFKTGKVILDRTINEIHEVAILKKK